MGLVYRAFQQDMKGGSSPEGCASFHQPRMAPGDSSARLGAIAISNVECPLGAVTESLRTAVRSSRWNSLMANLCPEAFEAEEHFDDRRI